MKDAPEPAGDSDEEVKRWLAKIQAAKKGDMDLSRDEDLSIALMNLISLEEHFYFTAMKTEDAKYLDMLNAVRGLRKKLLGKIVTEPQGEEWCISKHLLAASMRLTEVGTKELSKGNRDDATFLFQSAFNLYSLFFAINLKMVEPKELKAKAGRAEDDGKGNMTKLSAIIKKLVDCCKEW